ncbi:M13-type metalloendopeptidase [Caulobacter segnis]
MAPATKQAALTKLSKMSVMARLSRQVARLFGAEDRRRRPLRQRRAAAALEWAYSLSDLGKPVDHGKWGMTPQTVNAYNGGLENKIVFPAGILQAPFFDPAADLAVNYGAIGAVIGHEISHGFDDQGRKIDDTGKLRDWWTVEDAKRFEAQAAVLGGQYGAYEPVPGMKINPALTMGENIADLAGLQVAYDAYHAR